MLITALELFCINFWLRTVAAAPVPPPLRTVHTPWYS